MSKKCAVTMIFLVGSVMVFATSYVGLQKGIIHHAYVEYEDANSISITAGYGECNGNYFEVTQSQVYDVNYIPTGEDFIYIYVDDSESSYPTTTFCDSTTEPSWSDSKLGWYNGNDRCIGVVWTEDSSNDIKFFISNSYNKYKCDVKLVLYHESVSASWTTVETTNYLPVNALGVYVWANNWDVGSDVYVMVSSYEDDRRLSTWAYQVAECTGWIDLERNCSRDLRYRGGSGDDSLFTLGIWGYQIER